MPLGLGRAMLYRSAAIEQDPAVIRKSVAIAQSKVTKPKSDMESAIMKTGWVATIATGTLLLGIGIGVAWSKSTALGISTIQGKPPAEAAAAALNEAERLAGKGTWELIGVGRVYYLSGDKAHGQALFDRVLSGKAEASDLQRVAEVYAEAGENDRAADLFQKVLAMNPKDDTGQAEIGSWYLRIGQREKGEALLAQSLQRNPEEVWTYVRMAEAFLGVRDR